MLKLKTELKGYLLNTGCFLNNLYLDEYIKLVFTVDSSYTYEEEHHIIPCSYYKYKFNCKTRRAAEKYAMQDKNNFIVKLSFLSHCKAHYLLANCTTGKLAYAMRTCFAMMRRVNNKELTFNDFNLLQEYYDSICLKISKDELYDYFIVRQKTLSELAEIYQVSKSTIRRKLTSYSIYKNKKSAEVKLNNVVLENLCNKTDFIEYAKTHSQSQTSAMFNLTRNQVQRAMARLGISNYSTDYKKTGRGGWNKGLKKQQSNFYSAELLDKLSAARKGKVLTSEQKCLLQQKSPLKKKVFCVELNKTFDSVSEAARFIGCAPANITFCCKNHNKTIFGYHWNYFDESKIED